MRFDIAFDLAALVPPIWIAAVGILFAGVGLCGLAAAMWSRARLQWVRYREFDDLDDDKPNF